MLKRRSALTTHHSPLTCHVSRVTRHDFPTFAPTKTYPMECIDKLDGNVIVSDEYGKIIYMNERAVAQYEKEGGSSLIGRDLLECHSEASRKKILEIMATGQNNVYTIEKHGRKKIIYQSPWFRDGEFRGIIELSLVIPAEMPHFKRD